MWIIYALLAGILVGVASFIIGPTATYGIKSRLLLTLGSSIFIVIYWIIKLIVRRVVRGYFYSWETSNFRDTDGSVWWSSVFWAFGFAIVQFLNGYTFILALRMALYARINQGVITALFSLNSVFSAFISYFRFNEKLRVYYWIGMIFIIGCGVLISFTNTTPPEDEENQLPYVTPIIAVLMSLITALTYAIGGYFTKVACKVYKFESTEWVMIGFTILNIPCVILCIWIVQDPEITNEIIIRNMIGAFIATLSIIFLSKAIVTGYAGPSLALSSTQMIWNSLLNAIFYGEVLSTYEILALVVGFLGALIISLGPSIQGACC